MTEWTDDDYRRHARTLTATFNLADYAEENTTADDQSVLKMIPEEVLSVIRRTTPKEVASMIIGDDERHNSLNRSDAETNIPNDDTENLNSLTPIVTRQGLEGYITTCDDIIDEFLSQKVDIQTVEKALEVLSNELMKIHTEKHIPKEIVEAIEKVFAGKTITIDAFTEALQAMMYEATKENK